MAESTVMGDGGGRRSGGDRGGGGLLRQFRLEGKLSEDEWGTYWAATDREGERSFTVLELRGDLRRSKRVLTELRGGIRRLEGLRHPKVSGLRQMVTAGGAVCATGDAVEGSPLAAGGGGLPWTEVEPLAKDLAEVLDWAHGKGLVHGHLQPADVLLGEDGRLSGLLGLGADSSRLRLGAARGGGGTGWLAYRAPEAAGEHGETDDAGDQYAFAALLWELLCGTPPGVRTTFTGDAPEAVERALKRGLSAKPRQRFVSCGDLVRAACGEEVGGKRGAGAAERRARKKRLVAAGIAAAAAALLAGAAAGGTAMWKLARKSKAERVASAESAARRAGAPEEEKAEGGGGVRPLRGTPVVAEEGRNWATPDGMEYVWVSDLECWVGRFEVCNADYRQMDPEHDSGFYKGLPLDDDRQPAVKLNFDEMMDFADWLTERERGAGRIPEGWRFRLPTRGEAVACAEAGEAKPYPWGGAFPPPRGAGNYADAEFHDKLPGEPWLEGYFDGFAASAPVEQAGQNAWGLFGTGGNVWETTATDETAERFGGWHGGAFDEFRPDKITCKAFYGYMGTARGAVNGFRLVLAPEAGGEADGEPDGA